MALLNFTRSVLVSTTAFGNIVGNIYTPLDKRQR